MAIVEVCRPLLRQVAAWRRKGLMAVAPITHIQADGLGAAAVGMPKTAFRVSEFTETTAYQADCPTWHAQVAALRGVLGS